MTTRGTRRAGAAGDGDATGSRARESGLPRPLVGSVVDSNGIDQFGITETDDRRAGRKFHGAR